MIPNTRDGHDSRNAAILANHWHFSTETAFRIPELLDDVRHDLQNDLQKPRLKLLKGLLPSETDTPTVHLEFVRRVLTNKSQQRALNELARSEPALFPPSDARLCYQFTGSYVFGRFRRSSRNSPTGEESKEAINGTFEKAAKLVDRINRDKGLADAWRTTAAAFRAAYRGTNAERLLEELDHEAKKSLSAFSFENKFGFLSRLYVFYSRLSLVGEAVGTVSNVHFGPDGNDSFEEGRPGTLAYLLVSESGADRSLVRMGANGKLSPNLLPPDYRRPNTRWFPESERDEGTGRYSEGQRHILTMFGELWSLFNEELRGPRYDIVIPVYERSHMAEPLSQLVVKGAFLGWLFARIPAEETYLQLLKRPEQHLRGIQLLRFTLDHFAEKYLAGEKEWLLEQEWAGARNAEEFTVNSIHHCDGWIGDSSFTGSSELAQADYFAFCRKMPSGGLEQVGATTAACGKVTHLLVDLRRSERFDGLSGRKSLAIALEKRPDTALPRDPQELCDYAQRLVQTARQIYESATLLHSTRRREWSTFAHELKHIANALSEKWLVPFSSASKPTPESMIAPFPELITGAGAMIYLWCPYADISELIGNEGADRPVLDAGVRHGWTLALNGVLANVAKNRDMRRADTVREIGNLIAKAKSVWRFEDWWTLEGVGEFDRHTVEPIKLHQIIRVLCLVSTDIIRHAAISDGQRKCILCVDSNGIHVHIDTAHESEDENCLSRDFPLLNNIRKGSGTSVSEGLGSKILREIVEEKLRGSLKQEDGLLRHTRLVDIPI